MVRGAGAGFPARTRIWAAGIGTATWRLPRRLLPAAKLPASMSKPWGWTMPSRHGTNPCSPIGTWRLQFLCLLGFSLGCSPAPPPPARPEAAEARLPAQALAGAPATPQEPCGTGDHSACSRLLAEYEQSQKTESEAKRLAAVLEPACAHGDGPSCLWLGMRALEAPQGAREPRTSSLYVRACELGEKDACVTLGSRVLRSPRDDAQAKLVLDAKRRACALGVTKECQDAALWLLEPYGFTRRTELPSRATDALALFSRACLAGVASSCLYAAGLSDSEGLPTHDLPRAATLLDQGCRLGDGCACTRRMARRAIGRGIPADPEAALTELDRACHANVESACHSAKLLDSTEPHPWDECNQDQDCILGSHSCDVWCSPCWGSPEGLNGKWAAAAARDCQRQKQKAQNRRGPRPKCAPCPPAPAAHFLLVPTGVACVARHCVAF